MIKEAQSIREFKSILELWPASERNRRNRYTWADRASRTPWQLARTALWGKVNYLKVNLPSPGCSPDSPQTCPSWWTLKGGDLCLPGGRFLLYSSYRLSTNCEALRWGSESARVLEDPRPTRQISQLQVQHETLSQKRKWAIEKDVCCGSSYSCLYMNTHRP